MIEKLHLSKKTDYQSLLNFITSDFDFDFYYTKDNARLYISDIPTLKRFLKECHNIYILNDRGDFQGIAALWKSVGGGKKRYYVKLKAINDVIAKNVLTVLLWNTKTEVYAKIRKDNRYAQVFRNKGFRFLGGRGIQILLMYKPKKEKETINGPANNFNQSRNIN